MSDTAPLPFAPSAPVDALIADWRDALMVRRGVAPTDVDELEDHLRGHLMSLTAVGLTDEEAFLVAVQRVGRQDAIAAGLAREHTGRLWRQYVGGDSGLTPTRTGALGMLAFAAAAGLAIRIPLGFALDQPSPLPLNHAVIALLALAVVLTGYVAWRRRPPVVAVLVAIAVLITALGGALLGYPFVDPRETQLLGLLHAPIAIGVALGACYLGRDWRRLDQWMDYLRFLGELAIYYALIALGGGVLLALASGVFVAVGIDPEVGLLEWALPLGIGGAIVVAAWLVEAKQSVVENMAPVLSLVFTPLLTLLLLMFLVALGVGGPPAEADRNVLIIIDLVLVVVLALHVFSVSARPSGAPAGWFDYLQLLLLVAAVAVDIVLLIAMAGRIADYGASPNKLAALGENIVLLGNLAWAAWLSLGFVRGRRPFADLERWQCGYLPVIGLWAVLVVFALPPLFGFR